MDVDDDEIPTCPLCLEELDATDRAVKACQCGYQVCLWCLHHIREQLNGRCPACRTPYEEHNFKFAEVNPEQAAKEAKERATAKRDRERREKDREIERERARAAAVSQQKAKNNLKHARIIQRNLVYVIGLSLTLAREEVIRRADMFGKFGRTLRILVNRAHPFNADAPGGPSISAYVQYARDSDASAAVRAMSNTVFDGREIRCAIATTKYCDVFVRSASAALADHTFALHCGNPSCLYFHAFSPPESVLTREEVLAQQLGPPPPAHLFVSDPRRPSIHPVLHHRAPASASPRIPRPLPNTSSSSPPSAPRSAPTVPIPLRNKSADPSPNPTPPASPDPSHPSGRLTRAPTVDPPLHSHPPTTYPLSSSPPTSSFPAPQLPSSVGWASSQTIHTTSRSPPRRDPSVSLDELSRKPRAPLRRSRENAPPGFEDAPSISPPPMPSRPPGFNTPPRSAPRSLPRTDNTRPTQSVLAPPPGFGPGPAAAANISANSSVTANSSTSAKPTVHMPDKKDGIMENRSANAVAAAWSQEASTDEVFSTKDRRPSRTAGSLGGLSGRIAPDDAGARSELALVLAKIGGDLGVSSEFQSVQQVTAASLPAPTNRPQKVNGSVQASPDMPLGPLFGEQQHVHSTHLSSGGPAPSAVDSKTISYESSSRPPFPNNSQPNFRSEIIQSRRNNSRFGFAREDPPSLSQVVPGPVPAKKPPMDVVSSSPVPTMASSGIIRNGITSTLPATLNGAPVESRVKSSAKQITRQATQPPPTRQSRSRFDFADQAPSPPKSRHVAHVTVSHNPHSTATTVEPVNDAFAASFAQLSTAEKLASIFSSAQWSAEALPPMPSFESQVDPMSQPNEVHAVQPQMNGVPSNGIPSIAVTTRPPDSSEEKEHPPAPRKEPLPFAPPGFREATSGISPETTAVDSPSATAGVATNVASGGADNETQGQVEESVSSGAESLEEDRKRSRAQRKRDKKARQLREAAERKTSEARPTNSEQMVIASKVAPVENPGETKGQAIVPQPPSEPQAISNSTVVQILAKPKETSKQLELTKSTEDPGRFMSVSELEREVEAARAREAQLQDRLLELQRRIRSYDNVRT